MSSGECKTVKHLLSSHSALFRHRMTNFKHKISLYAFYVLLYPCDARISFIMSVLELESFISTIEEVVSAIYQLYKGISP